MACSHSSGKRAHTTDDNTTTCLYSVALYVLQLGLFPGMTNTQLRTIHAVICVVRPPVYVCRAYPHTSHVLRVVQGQDLVDVSSLVPNQSAGVDGTCTYRCNVLAVFIKKKTNRGECETRPHPT